MRFVNRSGCHSAAAFCYGDGEMDIVFERMNI